MAVNADKLDDAARAAWLYYIAGNTQDQIAEAMGISRQSAQRLVSLAASSGLVKVKIDHPIAACLRLAADLTERYDLDFCDVVPTDRVMKSPVAGIAQATAAELERWLRRDAPAVIAIGTGRTLKATVEALPRIACRQHKVVSLTGNISPDGSAAYYNVVFTMADTIDSRSFPMPLPVFASSRQEREMLHAQAMIRPTLDLAAQADVTFVGIGELGEDAPLLVDGFATREEIDALARAGAIAEIVGWAFDADGTLIEGLTNARVASAPIPGRGRVIATARGESKLPGIRAALKGRLINSLITDEATAEALLER